MVQSLFINTLAAWVIVADEERWAMGWRERVWGYTGGMGMVQGFSAGYFWWDGLVSAADVGVHGWGAVVHAACAVAVSGLGFVGLSLGRACLGSVGLKIEAGADFWGGGCLASVLKLLRSQFRAIRALNPIFECPLVLG